MEMAKNLKDFRVEKIGYFDIETKYLFQDHEPNWDSLPGWKRKELRDKIALKLEIAVCGILIGDKPTLYEDDKVTSLEKDLLSLDKIIGHNLVGFDYPVLLRYFKKETVQSLQKKTFDILIDLDQRTGSWAKLDELAKLNLGMEKTVDPLKIPKMWRDGQRKEVKDYLKNDLRLTKNIHEYGKKNGKLKYFDKNYGTIIGEKIVEVDWK